MDSARSTILHSLVWLIAPLNETRIDLANYGWDSDEAVVFGTAPVLSVLARYIEGEISDDIVALWAETIESREDIEFRSESPLQIVDVIYELANPELEGQLNPKKAAEILRQLRVFP